MCAVLYVLRAELMTVADFWGKFCENLRKLWRSLLYPSSDFKNIYYSKKMDKILSAALVFTNKHGAIFLKIRNLYFALSLRCCLDFVP
jgi:hypothetical protein